MKNIKKGSQINAAVNERLQQGYAAHSVQLQVGEALHRMKNIKNAHK